MNLEEEVGETKYPKMEKDVKVKSDIKRNFFAHSGFLKNCISIEKISEKDLLVKYKEKYFKDIKSWINNPS